MFSGFNILVKFGIFNIPSSRRFSQKKLQTSCFPHFGMISGFCVLFEINIKGTCNFSWSFFRWIFKEIDFINWIWLEIFSELSILVRLIFKAMSIIKLNLNSVSEIF